MGAYGSEDAVGDSIALAIPHTPWVPERCKSLSRLWLTLDGEADFERVFQDRESNRVWSQKLWRWGLETGAAWLVQIQDDALVAPNFWPALRAMTKAQPGRLIGLEANHPLASEQFRVGRHWYRTRAWLVGVGYAFPRELLARFVAWCDVNPKRVETTNEDSLVSEWAFEHGVDVWHPVPTILDHDLGVPSSYANDTHHEFSMYRKSVVTWKDVPRIEALEDVDYWRLTEAPLLPSAGTQKCWFCGEEEGRFTSPKTGARVGTQCLAQMFGALLSRV